MKKGMEWSPQDALKAYLQTLHLCKPNNMQNQEESLSGDTNKTQQEEMNNLVESQGSELISAMAAGNQAKVLVEIITTSKQGITPFTIALAVAAKQTNGKLTCIIPHHNGYNLTLRKIKNELSLYGIDTINHHDDDHVRDHDSGVVELRVGDPYKNISDINNIDIVVIDCKFGQTCLRSLCRRLDLNPKGAVIVANNVSNRTQGVSVVDEILKGKRGVESSVTTLPMGCGGIQVIIRIKPLMMHDKKTPQRRRQNRFLVTFDD